MNDLGNPSNNMINLGAESLEAFYSGEPNLEIIARALSRHESWAFDNDEFHPLSDTQENMLMAASQELTPFVSMLKPSVELVQFLLAISSKRRLPLLSWLGEANPPLIPDLTNFAYQRSDEDPFCAQFIHWMDAIDFALEALRGDSNDDMSEV